MGNASIVHTERALVKVIEDPTTVRVKVCPRVVYRDDRPSDNQDDRPEYDENAGALETDLSWEECNILIRHIRTHRDRVYGKAE